MTRRLFLAFVVYTSVVSGFSRTVLLAQTLDRTKPLPIGRPWRSRKA